MIVHKYLSYILISLLFGIVACKAGTVEVKSPSLQCTDAETRFCDSNDTDSEIAIEPSDSGSSDSCEDCSANVRDSGRASERVDSGRTDSCVDCDVPDAGGAGAEDRDVRDEGVESPDRREPPDTGNPDLVEGPNPTYDDNTNTGRKWPETYGQPNLCLWKDDKTAALSITIDDNTAPNHDWWIEQGNQYGFRFTWFVVAGVVDSPTSSYYGTWEGFNRLFSLGHDIQSHSLTHLGGEYDLDTEYGESKRLIEEKIDGARCLTIAYPGGTEMQNDPEVAAKYYIGARGVTGVLNPIGDTNYMETGSVSSFNFETNHWASVVNIIRYNANQPSQYRAWYAMDYHNISELTDEVIEGLEYVKENEAEIWVGVFREVSLYGQERDSATLLTPGVSDDQIRLEITDELDDTIFDFPLTVKVRLNSTWTQIEAVQGGHEMDATIITHEGNPYALVSVIPDRGPTTISRVR